MTTFTIDSDDHIERITGNRKPDAGDHFSSLDELGQLTEPWLRCLAWCVSGIAFRVQRQ